MILELLNGVRLEKSEILVKLFYTKFKRLII